MNDLSPRVYKEILRLDLGYFAQLCFCELNPQAAFLPNWHIEVIAAKLAAVRAGRIRRLIINLPPRHLKSLLASIAFPAWCLGHDPSAQILCVSYAQDLAISLGCLLTGVCSMDAAEQWERCACSIGIPPIIIFVPGSYVSDKHICYVFCPIS